jgi:soluble lytic murein transglycosylase
MLKLFLASFLLISSASAYAADACVALAKKEKWAAATECANNSGNPVKQRLISWLKLKSTSYKANFQELARFIEQNPHFPEIANLVQKAELSITDSVSDDQLRIWFSKFSPRTGNAYRHYLRLLNPNEKTYANFVKKAWILGGFGKDGTREFYNQYRNYLSNKDHYLKVDRQIWENKNALDSFSLSLLFPDQQDLIKTRLALLSGKKHYDQALREVPKKFHDDPGFIYARAIWLKSKGHMHALAKLLIDYKHIHGTKTDHWAKLRLVLATDLIDEGSYKLAYQLVESNQYDDSVNIVDTEWMAGKIAYMYLNNKKLALKHFENIYRSAKYSVSKAKGAYWAGMTANKLGMKDQAQWFFSEAAKYPDCFYGQLGISRTEHKSFSISQAPADLDNMNSWLNSNYVVRIAEVMLKNNMHWDSRKFMQAAVNSADSFAKKYALVKYGVKVNAPFLSVIAGKELARQGNFSLHGSYPVLSFNPPERLEKAFMLAIIRQESEYDQYAGSAKAARGLMQLIPGTAKDMCKKLGLKYSENNVTASASFNMTLGSNYLADLVENFEGSYVLAMIGYNAGPGNASKWVKRFGDPRHLKTTDEMVEWIEKIPFYETRGYVQNVLANLHIYRNLLKNPKTTQLYFSGNLTK